MKLPLLECFVAPRTIHRSSRPGGGDLSALLPYNIITRPQKNLEADSESQQPDASVSSQLLSTVQFQVEQAYLSLLTFEPKMLPDIL